MRTLVKAILTIAVVGGFLAGSASAEAGFRLRINAGSTGPGVDVDITDNGAGDNSALAGVISTGVIQVGNFDITLTLGTSKPSNAEPELMHLNVFASKIIAGVGTADTLTVDLTDTGWILGGPGILVTDANVTISGGITSVTYQTFSDNDHTGIDNGGEFHMDDKSSSVQTFTGSGGGKNSLAFDGSPLSLTQRVVISVGDGVGSTSGDFNIATPLPGGVILALTGIPALGVGAWIRRRKTTLAA